MLDLDTWVNYVFLSWLPTYMNSKLQFNLAQSGVFAFLPYLIKGLLAPLTGIAAEQMQRRGVRVVGAPSSSPTSLIRAVLRKSMELVALLVPSLCLTLISFVDMPANAVVALLVLPFIFPLLLTSLSDDRHWPGELSWCGRGLQPLRPVYQVCGCSVLVRLLLT